MKIHIKPVNPILLLLIVFVILKFSTIGLVAIIGTTFLSVIIPLKKLNNSTGEKYASHYIKKIEIDEI